MTDRDIDLHYLRIGAKILDQQAVEWMEKNGVSLLALSDEVSKLSEKPMTPQSLLDNELKKLHEVLNLPINR